MATRYIYLSEDLNMKLKAEDNASGLICDLLNRHYAIQKPQEDIKADLRAEAEAKAKDLEAIHDKIAKIDNKEAENLKIEANEQAESNTLEQIREFWQNISEEDKAEYLQGIKDKKWTSTIEYAKLKLSLL